MSIKKQKEKLVEIHSRIEKLIDEMKEIRVSLQTHIGSPVVASNNHVLKAWKLNIPSHVEWDFFKMLQKKPDQLKEWNDTGDAGQRIWKVKDWLDLYTQQSWECDKELLDLKVHTPPGLLYVECPCPDILEQGIGEMKALLDEQLKDRKKLPTCLQLPVIDREHPPAKLKHKNPPSLKVLFSGEVGDNADYLLGDIREKYLSKPYFQQTYPTFMKMVNAYAEKLGNMYGIDQDTVNKNVVMTVIKYPEHMGLRQHIDSLYRVHGSPAIVVHMGTDDVTNFDMIPLAMKETHHVPMRLEIKKGSFVIMGGESRYHWLHGVPDGRPGVKYTLMFKFQPIPEKMGKEPLPTSDMFGTEMIDLPVVEI